MNDVLISQEKALGVITFHHPKGNSLPATTLAQLREAVVRASREDSIKVVLLQSKGDGAFCAGASFDELVAVKTPESGKEFFMGFARVILAMRDCSKFILTRVQGKVVGGGVGLVAASDYVFGHESAAFRLSELALGIGPFVVGPCIERKIGVAAFQTMAIDADWRSAAWAKERGLLTEVYSTMAELDEKARRFSEKLTTYSPQAMAELKAVFRRGAEDWDTLLEARAGISGRLVLSADAQDTIRRIRDESGGSGAKSR